MENLEEIERIFRENFNEISHEVILINDFSTDETFSKAKDMSERNKNYILLDNKKKGLGGAITLGIENANGKFISRCWHVDDSAAFSCQSSTNL